MKKLFLLGIWLVTHSFAQPPSLKNCGNSCYINATAQALISIDSLTNFLKEAPSPFYYTQNSFGNSFQELIKKSNPNPPDTILNSFIQKSRALMGRSTSGTRQGDASEFVEKALDALIGNENLAPLLYITIGSKRFCSIEDAEVEMASTMQSERILKLPTQAPKNAIISSLQEGLAQYLEAESIAYIQGQECKNINNIMDVGPFFCIALNRFWYDGSKAHKIDNPISMPFIVDLTPFVLNGRKNFFYSLQAAVIHEGSPTAGHYYAYVNHRGLWYLCNDSIIRSVTPQQAQAAINHGYFFIYKEMDAPQLIAHNLELLQLELQKLLTLLRAR